MYDATLFVVQKQERYVRFDGVDFGIAPKARWPELRRSLLPIEHALSCR